ncbi:MAG: restriction endonuclease subunit S [Deltaproteobacteria bacterium]|nr:restriction endonuclease subunit S [Deltaproteobacteria bacterium]MBW2632144.1 restriction endonuclease subunit S [Deltaproteobacteria bacterium]
MRLRDIANVQSGYLGRGKIEAAADGSYQLLQAKDMDADRLTYRRDTVIRFNPELSRKDWILQKDDIVFMARGARNFAVLLEDIPEPLLAAACFFIIRVSNEKTLPNYLWWYLNQVPVEDYLHRESGRGVHMPVVRRAVLENMGIPFPPLETQQKIVALDALMRTEQKLLTTMAEKRRELANAVCLKAALTIRKQ